MKEAWHKKRKRTLLLVIFCLLVLCTPLAIIGGNHIGLLHAASGANITVNYAQPLRTLSPFAIGGIDESAYGAPDVLVNDTLQQQRLRALGTIAYMRINLRYKTAGDSSSGIVCGAGGCDTRWSGDAWVNAIKALGATPIVEDPTNPNDLPNLVKHFNIDTHNRVGRWLGGINEPNMNGEDATTYSTNFNKTYDAMKAIDPTIQIGGPTLAWYDPSFLQTFLMLSGSRVDFLDFHGYAQELSQLSYAELFAKSATYETDITNLSQLIQKIVPSRASHITIEIGEWDLDGQGHLLEYTPFDTAWGASTIGHIIRAGGISMLYADKGNLLLENGTDMAGGAIDETTPMYHALGMYMGEGLFRPFGSVLVQATTSLPNIEVYASDKAKNIVVINTDPTATQKGVFQLEGVTSGTAEIWSKNQSISVTSPPKRVGTATIQNGSFSYTLPPFSVTTFVVNALATGSVTPTATSRAGVTPTATSRAGVTPTATSRAGVTPTATSRAGVTPTATARGTACVGDGVYVYQNSNYSGICEKFTANAPELRGTLVGSDTATSIKIVGNYIATLYADTNYQGASSVVTSAVPYLGALAVGNDALSSLKVQHT